MEEKNESLEFDFDTYGVMNYTEQFGKDEGKAATTFPSFK